MDLARAVEGLLTGFEAEGHAVQPIAWDAYETLPGHFDVRYSFLLDAQDAEIIFLFDREEGRVSPANGLARAVVTIATTVDIGEGPAPPVKVKPGGERTAADIQAEITIKQRELEGIYEDYLARFPHTNRGLSAATNAGSRVILVRKLATMPILISRPKRTSVRKSETHSNMNPMVTTIAV